MATNMSRRPYWQVGRLAALCVAALGLVAHAAAATFAVNSIVDIPDISPGNGICETAFGSGVCTLRAAVQEANAHDGADEIVLQSNTTYLLARIGIDDTALDGDLDITDSVTITGGGPATVVDGNGPLTQERVFDIPVGCIDNAGFPPNCSKGALVANLSSLTIQHGTAITTGGGIRNYAALTVDHCVIAGNSLTGATTYGGGIESLGSLVLKNSVVANNTAAGSGIGAGVYTAGPLTVDGTTFVGNQAAGFGGGLGMYGASFKAFVRNSTFDGNDAALGGAIYDDQAALTLINSTISGNTSTGGGGGLFVGAGSTAKLFNMTIASNRANRDAANGGDGGGLYNGATTIAVQVVNSIIGNNTRLIAGKNAPPIVDADDCSGTFTSLGNNLLTSVDVAHCAINGAYVQAAANIDPLRDNGGPTKTQSLLVASPAVDGGNLGGCTDNLGGALMTDQRGFPRPNGPHCDIGAFELQEFIFAYGFEPEL